MAATAPGFTNRCHIHLSWSKVNGGTASPCLRGTKRRQGLVVPRSCFRCCLESYSAGFKRRDEPLEIKHELWELNQQRQHSVKTGVYLGLSRSNKVCYFGWQRRPDRWSVQSFLNITYLIFCHTRHTL